MAAFYLKLENDVKCPRGKRLKIWWASVKYFNSKDYLNL